MGVKDIAQVIRKRTPTPSDIRTVQHTLKVLMNAGLVNRLPYLDLERERGAGVSYVYGLSPKGVKYVRDFYDDRCKAFDHHSQRTLDHELEITHFHMKLKRMCEGKPLTLYWQQNDLKRTVNPDALFAITDHTKPHGSDTMYYFLEIERAKLGHYQNGEPSIMEKLGKYYNFYSTPDCEKRWGFDRFRVIVVQTTADRRYNLLAQLHKNYDHRMFWLTTEPMYREDIGGNIFATPKDYIEKSYSLSPGSLC
jgi:DNA-binding transcriptional ArsR family regulator